MFREIYPLQFSPPKWWGPQKTRVFKVAKTGGRFQPLFRTSPVAMQSPIVSMSLVTPEMLVAKGSTASRCQTTKTFSSLVPKKPIGSMGFKRYISLRIYQQTSTKCR